MEECLVSEELKPSWHLRELYPLPSSEVADQLLMEHPTLTLTRD